MAEQQQQQQQPHKTSAWEKAKHGGKATFDKGWAAFEKLGAPVNKLTNKIGSEAFWPTQLGPESNKAARILKSFCSMPSPTPCSHLILIGYLQRMDSILNNRQANPTPQAQRTNRKFSSRFLRRLYRTVSGWQYSVRCERDFGFREQVAQAC